MKAFRPLQLLWREQIVLRYYRRALVELTRKTPCHEDVSFLVLAINHLEASQ
jgi:hypothetical protein